MSNEIDSLEDKLEDRPEKTFRDSIYGGIDVSVKTMDKIIIVLFILIGLSIIFGVFV